MQLALKGVNKPIKVEVEKVWHAITLLLGSSAFHIDWPELLVLLYTKVFHIGHSMAQAVSRRPPTVEARVRSQVSP
jgi:hypothetical protein